MTGRPRIDINWTDFEKLCYMQCTLDEIAWWFECDTKTVERAVKRQYGESFGVIHQRKGARGKIALRRTMFQLAIDDKCEGMLKYLDRKYLGGTPFDQVRENNLNIQVNTAKQVEAEATPTTVLLRTMLQLPSVTEEQEPAGVIDITGTQPDDGIS